MRRIERMYRDFCERIAKDCEDEANRYAKDPDLRESDLQFVRVLRERCKQWRREVERLDAAYPVDSQVRLN